MRTKTPTTFNSLSKAADALKSTLVDYTFAEVNNTKVLVLATQLTSSMAYVIWVLMASPLMAFPLLSNLGTGGTGEVVIGDVDPAHYTGEFI